MSEQSVAEIIPNAVLTQHIVVLGKTRSGKSSTMRLLVERLLDLDKPVCIIDPQGRLVGLKVIGRRQARRLSGDNLRRRAWRHAAQ